MRSRGQKFSQTSEWEDDHDDSMFETQYADDNAYRSDLDHSRLYITNIPSGLNDDGLRAAFSKFGSLVEVFLSKNPQKKYAMVKYETPGEAKQAMMQMNRTEPLKLNIHIAHKSNKKIEAKPRGEWANQSNSNRYETGSVDSKAGGSRAQDTAVTDTMTNGGNTDEVLEDDYGFSDVQDPKLEFELETLKMEQLKVKEEQLQCKSRMLKLMRQDKGTHSRVGLSNKCILPDGKIVLRTPERSADLDVNNSAGAGDSVRSRACVACGVTADLFCARCGVTPYCSPKCQSKDWIGRHRAVCHNLARYSGELDGRIAPVEAKEEPSIQNPAPLRRPHTVTVKSKDDETNTQGSNGSNKSDNYRQQQDKGKPAGRGGYNQGYKSRYPNNNSRNNSQMQPLTRTVHQHRQPETQEPAKPVVDTVKEVRPAVNQEPVNKIEVKAMVHSAATVVKASEVASAPVPAPKSPQVNSVQQNPPTVKPANLGDVTPTKKVTPRNYLIEQLSIGDELMLSVDAKASDCKSPVGDYVCLSMHEKFQSDYQLLIEDFNVECDADEVQHKPIPGEICAYFNVEDSGWYRVRSLGPTTVAFIDGSKVVTVTPTDKLRKLSAKYENIPEYCCVLESQNVEVGANFQAKLVSKSGDRYKVSLTNMDTGASAGDGFVSRWVPPVEYPSAKPAFPEVPRPPLASGSRVLLVHAGQKLGYVRPADTPSQTDYDDVLQNTLLAGFKATPLKQPPVKGQVVISQYSDGLHYRAMVKRTQYAQNKYMLEFIDYGNSEIYIGLDKIFPCPPNLNLDAIPTHVSMIRLAELSAEDEQLLLVKKAIDNKELEPPAEEYVNKLKDANEEMILSLPDGKAEAPSGSLANLKLVKNNENVNKKILGLCTPEWRKFQDKGGDVVDVEPLTFNDLEYKELPPGPIELEVLDISLLQGGVLGAAVKGDPHTAFVHNQLTEKMAEYCNSELGREPYLPKLEELCIAKCPPYPQWFRAVLMRQPAGAGAPTAEVCYVDYGNLETIPVTLLRKMLPEFVRGVPAVAWNLEIQDFPENPDTDTLIRVSEHLQLNEEGRGVLRITRSVKTLTGGYKVYAPDLIRAMMG